MKNTNIKPWYRQSVYRKDIHKNANKLDEEIDFIAIGDLHGCYNTLQDLLSFAKVNIPNFEKYKIISVGDITNKGGEKACINGDKDNSGSVNTLRWALKLYYEGKLLIVDSNHGRNLIKRLRYNKVSNNPNIEMTYKDILMQVDYSKFRDEIISFLDQLPPYLRVLSKNKREYIIAHASASDRLLKQDNLSKVEYDYFLYNNNDFKWNNNSTVITGHVGVNKPEKISFNNGEIIRLDTKVETGNGLSFYDSVTKTLSTIPTNKKDINM